MKTAQFRQIRNQVTHLTHLHSPNNKLIGVEIETLTMARRTLKHGSKPQRRRDPQLLTTAQLEYFEYIGSFINTKGINL